MKDAVRLRKWALGRWCLMCEGGDVRMDEWTQISRQTNERTDGQAGRQTDKRMDRDGDEESCTCSSGALLYRLTDTRARYLWSTGA